MMDITDETGEGERRTSFRKISQKTWCRRSLSTEAGRGKARRTFGRRAVSNQPQTYPPE